MLVIIGPPWVSFVEHYLGVRIFLLIAFSIARKYFLDELFNGGSDCSRRLSTVVSQSLGCLLYTVAFAASIDLGKMLWLSVGNGPLVITQVEVLGLSISTIVGCWLLPCNIVIVAVSVGCLGNHLLLLYWLFELMVCYRTSIGLKWSSNLGQVDNTSNLSENVLDAEEFIHLSQSKLVILLSQFCAVTESLEENESLAGPLCSYCLLQKL